MTLEINPAGTAAAVQSQASILVLTKSLKLQQSAAARLLDDLPGTSPQTFAPGPSVPGMGEQLDAFA